MTSRERIMTSIAHKEPDRVARDLGATPSSGISAIAYNNVIHHLGMTDVPDAQIYDVVQQLAQPALPVLDHFGIDVLDVGRTFNNLKTDWKPFPLGDGSNSTVPSWFEWEVSKDGGLDVIQNGIHIARMPVGATFFDGTYVPYPDEIPESFEDLDLQMSRILWAAMTHSPWDHKSEDDFWVQLRQRAIELKKNSDRALMIVAGCNLFEWGTFLRRIDNFLCDLIVDPEGVERLLDELMIRHLANLEKICDAVGDVCDILRFGDDLGMDTGPFMQPSLYHELFFPRHKQLNEYVHKHSNMKTFLHSCGSIYSLMPDLIEAGYDVLNPIQITARDMQAEKLKRDFGKDICFWGGGCDTRVVLNSGTPQEVKDHVKAQVDILAPGGGFVFNTVHNIMPDVPAENVVAMFEALDEM